MYALSRCRSLLHLPYLRRYRSRCIVTVVEPFQALGPNQHQHLEAAVARIGELMEVESVALSVGAVEARPHL
jgi:hypothetical protein